MSFLFEGNEFGNCCNNIVPPFEGHYGVMNNYVVGSLDSNKKSASKNEPNTNVAQSSSSTIGYNEFSLFKTALNYLNANQKFTKAKNFFNSFRVKHPTGELDKSKSSSLDIEKQVSNDEADEADEVDAIAATARAIRSANFKESPIRTINVSFKDLYSALGSV